MTAVYLLWHNHDFGEDGSDEKLVGVYASERDAELARQRTLALDGFCDAPDGFIIDEYEVGRDHWDHGYATAVFARSLTKTRSKIMPEEVIAKATRQELLSSTQKPEREALLLSLAGTQWQKIARIIIRSLKQREETMWGPLAQAEDEALWDLYASLIRGLVADGRLEVQGNPDHPRHSEVRRPAV